MLPESLAPLRDHRFAWFFAARMISQAGSVMAPVALTFAVLEISPSPAALGGVLAARSVALVVFLLIGGVIADRFSRSAVLQISHLLSALTQGAVAALVISGRGQLSQIIALEVLNGAVTAVTMPAIQGVVPQVVPRSHLQQANALLAFSRGGLTILGPTVAALLAVTVGPGWALAVDALTWLAAALCMLRVRLPRPGLAGEPRGMSLLGDLSSGWAEFTSQRWLWGVVLAFGVLNAIHSGAWLTLGPVIALGSPAVGETGWGYALSAQAVGLLLLTVVMLRLRLRHPLRVGMLSMLGMALPLLALGTEPSVPLLVVTSFLAGAGVEVFSIAWQTTIHERVAPSHVARVSAYDMLGSFVAIPIGQTAAGPLAAGFGSREVVLWSAGLFVVVVFLTLAVPEVRGLQGAGSAGADPASPSDDADRPAPR